MSARFTIQPRYASATTAPATLDVSDIKLTYLHRPVSPQAGIHRKVSTMSANLLAHETSPYLLQHKDNPVHWMPWGEAAFERARSEGKPILLSIGYAACHWCHVMAHES